MTFEEILNQLNEISAALDTLSMRSGFGALPVYVDALEVDR